jgi:hypothetical protein
MDDFITMLPCAVVSGSQKDQHHPILPLTKDPHLVQIDLPPSWRGSFRVAILISAAGDITVSLSHVLHNPATHVDGYSLGVGVGYTFPRGITSSSYDN